LKTLIITGASKGIGLATAMQFLDAGYRVINISRTPAPDERIHNAAIDLSSSTLADDMSSLVSELVSEPGEIVLIHNAAKLQSDTTGDTDEKSFREIMDINLIAPHVINQCVLPKMTGGSSVLYVGSTLSEKAVPGSYTYVVSKHAMVGMMRATCQDLAGTGIHTACICPGFTNTEMLRAHVGQDETILAAIAASQTFNRLVEPDEIATTLMFAASQPVINGAILHANLGQVES